jgi:prepilin-type processing-associated H-X9-DG protein/prepilin-type N-terminal cleavage/methylation domain-containing protein
MTHVSTVNPIKHYSLRFISFTLVELLIVIAIISILSALLMPAIQKAKNSSKEIVCISNLRQNITAELAYSSDYNGLIPSLQYWASGDNAWHEFLTQSDYIKSKKVLLCPSWGPANYTNKYLTYGSQVTQQGLNPLYTVSDGTATFNMIFPNKIKYQSNFALLSDSIMIYSSSPNYHLLQVYAFSYALSGHNFVHLRHNGKASMAFLDGHAEKCSRSRIVDTTLKNYGNITIYVSDMNANAISINL